MLVEKLRDSGPRPRSPHMNNEEAINLSHYPDGRDPSEGIEQNGDDVDGSGRGSSRRERPIERDDFPAPPFFYSRQGHYGRRRHHSEPGSVSDRY